MGIEDGAVVSAVAFLVAEQLTKSKTADNKKVCAMNFDGLVISNNFKNVSFL